MHSFCEIGLELAADFLSHIGARAMKFRPAAFLRRGPYHVAVAIAKTNCCVGFVLMLPDVLGIVIAGGQIAIDGTTG